MMALPPNSGAGAAFKLSRSPELTLRFDTGAPAEGRTITLRTYVLGGPRAPRWPRRPCEDVRPPPLGSQGMLIVCLCLDPGSPVIVRGELGDQERELLGHIHAAEVLVRHIGLPMSVREDHIHHF